MRRTHSAARFLLSAALMVTTAGIAAPTATATAAEAESCTWTRTALRMPAGALAGSVTAADGEGGYAGALSYGAHSEKNGAAVWKNGEFTAYANLNDPDFQNRVAVHGLNDAGTVVGDVHRQATGFPAAVHSRNHGMERLPELPGAYASRAEGINDHGDVVGGVAIDDEDGNRWHPVLWPADKPGTVVALTGLPTGTDAIATGIDQDGTVLVSVGNGFGEDTPYLWKDGEARALPVPDRTRDVVTRGMSNGRVVADVTSYEGPPRSVLWDRDGEPRVVSRNADIRGINRDGQIVGRTDDPSWREQGVWRLTALDATLKWEPDRGLQLLVSSDDGTIAGRSWAIPGGRDEPTVWACR
ncbi:hypothetical protein GCM10018785_06160 [Streptomyces longispororuber]|uniref:Uncharacterized protein n=1 Tax=Streptomyces longispororuber TaxID=68230 RepID=A0A919DFR5_9ACTN|nr:hypothetical protein [Streptomyces longispororuber]GHE39327.1 hypothetical protein GCM10018785_06160 [Streptomyces longispororuber]